MSYYDDLINEIVKKKIGPRPRRSTLSDHVLPTLRDFLLEYASDHSYYRERHLDDLWYRYDRSNRRYWLQGAIDVFKMANAIRVHEGIPYDVEVDIYMEYSPLNAPLLPRVELLGDHVSWISPPHVTLVIRTPDWPRNNENNAQVPCEYMKSLTLEDPTVFGTCYHEVEGQGPLEPPLVFRRLFFRSDRQKNDIFMSRRIF